MSIAATSNACTIPDALKPRKAIAQITISNPAKTYNKIFITFIFSEPYG